MGKYRQVWGQTWGQTWGQNYFFFLGGTGAWVVWIPGEVGAAETMGIVARPVGDSVGVYGAWHRRSAVSVRRLHAAQWPLHGAWWRVG